MKEWQEYGRPGPIYVFDVTVFAHRTSSILELRPRRNNDAGPTSDLRGRSLSERCWPDAPMPFFPHQLFSANPGQFLVGPLDLDILTWAVLDLARGDPACSPAALRPIPAPDQYA